MTIFMLGYCDHGQAQQVTKLVINCGLLTICDCFLYSQKYFNTLNTKYEYFSINSYS